MVEHKMNVGFYSAATSAYYQQQRLNVISNNTANISTVGYKAQTPAFSALMYTNVNGIDGAQLPRGSGTRMEKTSTNFAQGEIYETTGMFDYAIEGNGFFALRDMQTGEISYTRAGNFQMAQVGNNYYLTDSSGIRYVLDRNGQTIPAARNANGVIDVDAKLPVGVYVFQNRDDMQHLGDNRFVPIDKNGQAQASDEQPLQGWLERSNTDITSEVTKVIRAQQAFSYALSMIRTSDEVETTINNLNG